MAIKKRIGCILLAAAMVLGLFTPAAGTAPLLTVQAVTESTGETTAQECTVTIIAENCTLLDPQEQPLEGTLHVTTGSEMKFQVIPAKGYAVTEVRMNAQTISAAEDGMYSCVVTGTDTIQAVCEAIPLESFTVAVSPDGPTREKQFQISLVPADAAFSEAAFSLEMFTSAEELKTAISSGNANIVTPETVITENGSYYLYLIDLDGNLLTQSVDVAEIDRIATEIVGITRTTESWSLEAEYLIEFPAEADVAKVFLQTNQDAPTEISSDINGQYGFYAKDNGTYTVTVYDSVGNVSTASVTESFIDHTGPEISVSRNPEGWSTNAMYTFQASDDGSGVASFEVSIGGNTTYIIADDEDTYIIRVASNQTVQIKAFDHVGNMSLYEIIESQIDTAAPEITSVMRITEGIAYVSSYRIIAADDASQVATVKVNYGNEEVPVTKDGDGSFLFSANANGEYVVTVTDNAGNATSATITEDLLDRDAPVISNISRLPLTWSQDACYSFQATDAFSGIDSVKVFLDSDEIIVESGADGNYQFPVETNGEYTITVSDKVGNTNSIVVSETKIDRTAPVIHDAFTQSEWDPATNQITIRASDESELSSVTVVDKNGTEYTVSKAEDDIYLATVDHNGEYTITTVDAAGNMASVTVSVQHIDSTAPDAPILVSTGEEKWVNTDITLTAKSNDTESGVLAYWYSSSSAIFDEATWNKMDNSQEVGELILTAEQDATYYVIAQNQAGLFSDISSIRIAIDKTAPETWSLVYQQEDNSGYYRTVEDLLVYRDFMVFHAEASDTASGVAAYEYKVIGQNYQSDWIRVEADAAGITQTVTGENDLSYIVLRTIDAAGNVSEDLTNLLDNGEPVLVAIENTPQEDSQRQEAPVISMYTGEQEYNGSWTGKDVTIQVTGSFAISGIERYEWRMIPLDPALTATEWANVPEEEEIAQLVLNTDINALLCFRAVSYAGNVSLVSQAEVRIQKTAPAAATIITESATGSNGWFTSYPKYEIALPEQNSYFAPVSYQVIWTHNGEAHSVTYDGTNAPVIDGDGAWTIQIQTIDAAGNVTQSDPADICVDTQAPTQLLVCLGTEDITNAKPDAAISFDKTVIADCNMFSDFTIFRNTPVTVTASASGGTSGMAAIYYQVVAENQEYSKTGKWELLPSTGLQLTPNRKCRLFFKAVDGAGNITYFTGKSIILDDTAPQGGAAMTELRITPSDANRSELGIYYGDVTVNIHVEDPFCDTSFSGLSAITYRVLADGRVTQSGTIYPGSGTVSNQEGRTLTWDGQIQISSTLNNTNHVVVEVSAIDQAGNTKTTQTADGAIQIDITAPQISAGYDVNKPATVFEEKGYFTGSRTLTVTVSERNFDASASFVYVTNKDTGESVKYTWISDGTNHTAFLRITEDGHYTVAASVTDGAGNTTETILFDEGTVAGNAFVIDNTNPIISVSYSNNTSNGIYFASPRTATVTVEDRNFTPDNFTAEITLTTEDGTVLTIPVENWECGTNFHTAQVNFTADGIYKLSVNCTDIPGNAAEEITYTGTAPQHWVLDQHISAPQISGIQNNTPYSGTVIPTVTFLDINLDRIELVLFRTRRNEIMVDVTEELLNGLPINIIAGGKQAILDIFPETQDMDGIYKLEARIKDKAGNSTVSAMTFSINRFGSVYAYGEYLAEIMGNYHYAITEDLEITEINPTRLIAGSATVHITRDGTLISNPIFTVNPIANGSEVPGNSGWYEYQYVIAKENFTEDGMYTVVLSTKDEAGNIPENTADAIAIRFAVDTSKPELSSVVGLEKSIVKADSLDVKFTAIDNIAIRRISVYVDNTLIESFADLTGYTYQDGFTIPAGLNRHVRIIIEDMAGNVLDTDESGFTPGYSWQDVTVSTNFLLRFYANTPLFIGSIILGTTSISALIILLLKKKKRIAG